MSAKIGRPKTGRKPNFVVRMNRTYSDIARAAAKGSGKQIGRWIEEAIIEKAEREDIDHQQQRREESLNLGQ